MEAVLKQTIKMQGHGSEAGKFTIPSFWESAGTISGGSAGLLELGRSSLSPAVFFVFADKEHLGPNGSFIATINLSDLLNEAVTEVGRQHAAWLAAHLAAEPTE